MGCYALPCRKLNMFLLSHSLFSVLVCRLLFRTLISKFYYEFFFLRTKKRQCSTPLFNIRTTNFSVEAERFFFNYHDHDYNYYNHNDYNYKYNLYIYYCYYYYYYYYLFIYLFIFFFFCGLRLTKAFITCSQSRSL